ncbi:DUF1820 family protein [Algiphilus aromaticivorans]|jgi:hypothetical protein|uniref:DUF1820 family protein n=1 Tax=Algiphilus aromaticivorans TaxID=382454 RepID=UPI0005C20C9A|nr:DUF1820 family protein [Algiphilus aromaticivorans]
MPQKHLYRVSFVQQNKLYDIYAREVSHEAMMGFVEIGDLVFGERSQVLVDPAEEKLQAEFEGVERFFVPVHQVVRIDQVNRRGKARISDVQGESGGKVTPLPIYGPGNSGA